MNVDKMTPKERVTFAHGKVKSSLENMRLTLGHQHMDITNKRQAWLAVTGSSLFLWVFALIYHGLKDWQDIILDAAIICSFIIINAMTYSIINNQIMFSNLLLELYSDLANSETLKFGTEDMAVENVKPNIKPDSQ